MSPNEIKKEIAALQDCVTFIPPTTFFGGDNREKVNVQIEALLDEWDEDKANEVHGEESECPDSNLLDASLEAIRWRDGDTEEAPSAGWEMYRPKKGGKS